MAWATEAQTLALTGVSVTADNLAQAQGIIDVYSMVTESASDDLKERDKEYLKKAVAYQAAWMARQVDVTTRMDVDNVSQDGVSYSLAHDDAVLLAPLAKRCLDRLTWRKSRSVDICPSGLRSPAYHSQNAEDDFLRDRGYQSWRPM